MSKNSDGDRDDFRSGLINEAVWLFWVLMDSDVWLWWGWRQDYLFISASKPHAHSATSPSVEFSLTNFIITKSSFSLSRRLMCVCPTHTHTLNGSTDCFHPFSLPSLLTEPHRHEFLQLTNVHRLHCWSPSLLGSLLTWMMFVCKHLPWGMLLLPKLPTLCHRAVHRCWMHSGCWGIQACVSHGFLCSFSWQSGRKVVATCFKNSEVSDSFQSVAFLSLQERLCPFVTGHIIQWLLSTELCFSDMFRVSSSTDYIPTCWATWLCEHPAALPQSLDMCLGKQLLERLPTGCSSNVGDQQQMYLMGRIRKMVSYCLISPSLMGSRHCILELLLLIACGRANLIKCDQIWVCWDCTGEVLCWFSTGCDGRGSCVWGSTRPHLT